MKKSYWLHILLFKLCLIQHFHTQITPGGLTGLHIIERMQKHYQPDGWYRYFTFSQTTEFYAKGNKVKEEIWHEAYSGPGNLIIKFNNLDSSNGVIFSKNKVHSIRSGKPVKSAQRIHELLLTSLDLYFMDAKVVTHLLDSLGFNTSLVSENKIGEKAVWVIGAKNGDTLSSQLWIDKQDKVLVMLQTISGKSTHKVYLEDYKMINKKRVATSIRFFEDATLIMKESYFNIKFPKVIPETIFDPEKFREAKW